MKKITTFITVASLLLLAPVGLQASESIETLSIAETSASVPHEKDHWLKKHYRKSEIGRQKPVNLVFIGDSITERWFWGPQYQIWTEVFGPYEPANMGISGDRTEHVLWRIVNGTLEHVDPQLVVLMIGTNNLWANSDDEIAAGVKACAKEIRARLPEAQLLVLGVFPRGSEVDDPNRARIKTINSMIEPLGKYDGITYRDIGDIFLEADGTLSEKIMPDGLHPGIEGYRLWADAMKPILVELIGAAPNQGAKIHPAP